MNYLIEKINARISFLERAKANAEKAVGSFPEGRLRISSGRYYRVTEKTGTNGEYLHKKEELFLIRQLAQKEYHKQFLKVAEAELKNLKECRSKCSKKQAEDAYNNLSDERQKLVSPYILPDYILAREWQSKIFKPNPYKPEKKIYDTRRGEKVRSKSEAIIADMLYEMGIPYRYEYPVKMDNGQIKYPDFMLLKVKTREIIYLEHFGRLDEEGYRKDLIEKLDIYRDSGIYVGKNLMFTYETEDSPLDIKGIRKMLEETLL